MKVEISNNPKTLMMTFADMPNGTVFGHSSPERASGTDLYLKVSKDAGVSLYDFFYFPYPTYFGDNMYFVWEVEALKVHPAKA